MNQYTCSCQIRLLRNRVSAPRIGRKATGTMLEPAAPLSSPTEPDPHHHFAHSQASCLPVSPTAHSPSITLQNAPAPSPAASAATPRLSACTRTTPRLSACTDTPQLVQPRAPVPRTQTTALPSRARDARSLPKPAPLSHRPPHRLPQNGLGVGPSGYCPGRLAAWNLRVGDC